MGAKGRGAVGANGVGAGVGVPLPLGGGPREGAVPIPRILAIFWCSLEHCFGS